MSESIPLSAHDLAIPELSLVLLIGASGSGKSTFAAHAFAPWEAISSDYCRGMVSNDPTDQNATTDAFALLHEIVATRLRRGLLTVVDATNVQASARKSLIALAKEHDVLPVAIVLDMPEKVCIERNKKRNVVFGESVVHKQVTQLRASLKGLGREGLRHIYVLNTPEEVERAHIVRTRLFNDLRDDHGPFDVIGDVHGCLDELLEILSKLGYNIVYSQTSESTPAAAHNASAPCRAATPSDAIHPDGRRVIFLGDLIDRGPNVVGVLKLAMGMTKNGHALAVPGNHEAKLVRALGRGAKIQTSHGLAQTLADLAAEGEGFTDEVRQWCDGLISHYVVDDGNLVVAHAGLKQAYHGRTSGRVRAFALYGDTTGESDEYGLPVRYPWANDYRGQAMVLYGHTPVPETQWVNNTLCLDTGCVFGGKLSAMRYPEKEIVQVPAAQVYSEPVRPLVIPEPARAPDVIDATDVLGRRTIQTRWMGPVSIQAEQAAGAFEVMSRFAAEPSRLAYLPPTMSPTQTSHLDGYLEHPIEAFDYFAKQGVVEVMCEEKHMGPRCVALVHRVPAHTDIIHTRTGRPFFTPDLEAQAVARIRTAMEKAGLWDEWDTDWVLLDAELLPWSLKAEPLIRDQYLPVGASAQAMYGAAIPALEQARDRGLDVSDMLARAEHRQANAAAYAHVVNTYSWETDHLTGVQIAPFQILATRGNSMYIQSHRWHMDIADQLSAADPEFIRPTRHIEVTTDNEESIATAVAWWDELTSSGAEGMVVKPMVAPVKNGQRLVQPGLKVRGREYLRMTYGPDYLDHLTDLRQRNLATKRSLALREYAVGLEAIDRLVADEPLWSRHEAVFAVLALESVPTDPRL